MAGLETWDFVAVALYFTAVIATGIYSMWKSNRGTVSGYFLAGRFMTWLPVGASMFASNIGSEHIIGLAGSGAAAGIAVGAFELNACVLLQLLGWVFFPVYVASSVCTLPEYTKKRFGGNRIRIYLTTISLVLYIFTKISVNLYSGALFIQQALHWDLYISVLLIIAATAFCTVTGGLTAVIYTDTLQSFVMVIGGLILTALSFVKVGGYQSLYYGYMNAIPNTTLNNPNTTCGYPRNDSWIMLRDPVDSDMPWPGFIFGQTPASIWYWCADQMMVQRALAAKSLSHAQGGTLFAGYTKLLVVFIMVMPGMISRVLFPDEVGCADPDVCEAVCQKRMGCSNIAYPKLVLELMPIGLKGVMMSVMLAALMSNLTSIFNSASTLFTMDVYRYIRKKASTKELMIVGRSFVCVMVVVSILWIPVIANMQGGQLYIYIQAIAAYLSPPIAAVYLLAVLWKRGNEKGAFWSLIVGMVIGVVRMTLDFIYPQPACGDVDNRPRMVSRLHYMYFAMIVFFLTGIVMVIISLLTEAPSKQQITRTTYWTRHDPILPENSNVKPNCDDKEHLTENDVEEKLESNGYAMEPVAYANGHTQKVMYEKGTAAENGAGDKILLQFEDKNEAKQEKGEPVIDVVEKKERSILRRGFDWFCGFNNDEETVAMKQAQLEHEQKVASLHQDPRAKIGLLIALCILNVIALGFYIFFSTGSSFGLL